MTQELLSFASPAYWAMFALLFFARGMDLLSTRVATPNLVLEGNPIARRLGWKIGGLLNLAICFLFALLPMAAIIIATAGVLVAAHNFHAAWLMRSMGEEAYRDWFVERITSTPISLFLTSLLGETALTALVGGAIVWATPTNAIVFPIGLGILAYAAIVLFYTSLSLWRLRRRME